MGSYGGVQKNKDGVPIWSGEATTFEEYVENCLLYEQTVVREKRYLCGPRIAAELRGPARRVLIGRPADWLSHEGGVRALVNALRSERGQPKVPEMSELLLKYFRGTRRQRGEPMGDFILRKAEAYTRAQQSMARYQREHTTRAGGSQPQTGSYARYGSSYDRSEANSVVAGDSQEPGLPPLESQSDEFHDIADEDQQWQWPEEWNDWSWGRSTWRQWWHEPERDTSEWGRGRLPEILPDFIQGWYLFMDSGLDVMERNVLHAELRGDFGVRAVEAVLRKHWSDSDIKKRDAEKGRYMSNMVNTEEEDDGLGYMGEWDPMSLEAEGFSAEEIEALAAEEETARQAWAAIQEGRRTLRDARARQHAVKMSRQYYPQRAPGAGQNPSWKQLSGSKPGLQCFRCGGPHKIADCKEKPKNSEASHAAEAEAAPFVFWTTPIEPEVADIEQLALACENGMQPQDEISMITTSQVVAEGKAVIDGGATRTIGSIAALEKVAELNASRHGDSGVEKVDFSDRPIFGFGNSCRNRCASTASLKVPMAGKFGSMRVHALDQGEAPILLSVDSLRRLGAIIDYEHDLAIFRSVDAGKVVPLERSSAGHQLLPLTEDVYTNARVLSRPMPSLAALE